MQARFPKPCYETLLLKGKETMPYTSSIRPWSRVRALRSQRAAVTTYKQHHLNSQYLPHLTVQANKINTNLSFVVISLVIALLYEYTQLTKT